MLFAFLMSQESAYLLPVPTLIFLQIKNATAIYIAHYRQHKKPTIIFIAYYRQQKFRGGKFSGIIFEGNRLRVLLIPGIRWGTFLLFYSIAGIK